MQLKAAVSAQARNKRDKKGEMFARVNQPMQDIKMAGVARWGFWNRPAIPQQLGITVYVLGIDVAGSL